MNATCSDNDNCMNATCHQAAQQPMTARCRRELEDSHTFACEQEHSTENGARHGTRSWHLTSWHKQATKKNHSAHST
jgi:hypothetical protein